MPAPKSVGFQKFCDGLRTDLWVIPMVGVALIQVPGLLQGTQGPNAVLLHPWSMKVQVMLDTPTGRRSLNTTAPVWIPVGISHGVCHG